MRPFRHPSNNHHKKMIKYIKVKPRYIRYSLQEKKKKNLVISYTDGLAQKLVQDISLKAKASYEIIYR